MQTHDLLITGMDCPDCARTLEAGVQSLSGVDTCAVQFAAGRMRVTFDPARLDANAIAARVRALGYGIGAAAPAEPGEAPPRGRGALLGDFYRYLLAQRSAGRATLIGGGLLLVGLGLGLAGPLAPAGAALQVLALLVAGYPVARAALRDLALSRRVTINLLMTIAAIGALVIGEVAEAATLLALFAIGEALEGFTMQRSREALRKLMQLAPAEATVLTPCMDCAGHRGRDGYTSGPCPWCGPHEERVPVSAVQVGQVVLVRPGERLPLDGTIARGASSISQQHVTGESLPVARGPGDAVYAGSINGEGAIEIDVTSPASESLLSRIGRLVEEAQAKRAPIERFVDRFAQYYTPAVVALAALLAAVPPLLLGQPFWNAADGTQGALYRALTLLVVACPCALVISTPASIVSALVAAARSGVLIKGGAALEALRRVRVFAFDKTGTLTTGHPRVTAVYCADRCATTGEPAAGCERCDDVLALAAAVENRSAHPLAAAVVQAAAARSLDRRYAAADDVVSLTGRGVQGTLPDGRVTVGSHALFDAEHAHDPALCARVSDAEQHGQTALLVCACDKGGVRGFITVADEPRSASRQALADLRDAGIAHTVMLTGDNQAVGQAIGAAVGVDAVRAGLLPAEKLAAVRELRERYGDVAMVGDGVNDTPALASATVGIAMGAAGSAQALEVADVALMGDDLGRLPFLVRLSRRTGAVVRQNISISLLSKLLFLGLASAGAASLWLAVVADVGVSLLVTLNGMRLLREQPHSGG